MHENKLICYVCKKKIKPSQSYYAIGENLSGIELYRHKRCKPSSLSIKELKQRKYWKK